MGNKTAKRPALRRLATFVAALGMLTMSSGVALMSTASAADGPNQEGYWETLPGEICTKTDTGAESGGYTVPAVADGYVWSKLIIKKGSGNIGIENQVFNNPVVGQVYTWIGFQPQQSGGWSHTILCRVPVVVEEPDVATASISVVQPDCDNENAPDIEFAGTNVVLPFDVDGTVAAGETVTVTATAVEGAEFAGGATTKVFEDVVFEAAEEGCDEVVTPPGEEPPGEEPGEETPEVEPPAVTPTVVASGVMPTGADLRGEQGLALLVAGMILMVLAGGLGLVRPAATRS